MLYYLFEYLEKQYQLTGASVFQFISFRAALAVIVSLLISMIFGKHIINFLRNQQIGETVRDLGLEGQKEKQGTQQWEGLLLLLQH